MYDIKRALSRKLKQNFSRENNLPDISDKCCFIFSGANQMKKNIGVMVDAFNLINKGDCRLILALKYIDCQIGTYKFHGEYDMQDLVNSPDILVVNTALSEEAHALLFKMSDFLLYPSQGEAPGLQMSEAQLAGCIPIATNYTGLAEESCFAEFLIEDFILHRGQFNCYRAIVGYKALAKKMQEALWMFQSLNDSSNRLHKAQIHRYGQFMEDVKTKFESRTWHNTALELDSVFSSLEAGSVRIDTELTQL